MNVQIFFADFDHPSFGYAWKSALKLLPISQQCREHIVQHYWHSRIYENEIAKPAFNRSCVKSVVLNKTGNMSSQPWNFPADLLDHRLNCKPHRMNRTKARIGNVRRQPQLSTTPEKVLLPTRSGRSGKHFHRHTHVLLHSLNKKCLALTRLPLPSKKDRNHHS